MDIVKEAETALVDAGLAGIRRGAGQLQVVDHAAIVKSQDLAKAYAHERAAEMVGKKWVNGSLVDNPNAQWVISDTTRDEIRRLVESAFSEETPISDLVEQIKTSGAFSAERADLIATTEISTAQSKANFEVWKQTAVVESHRWMVSSLGCCDECADNEAAGAVAFGELFPSGDDAPPAHPHCFVGETIVSAAGVSAHTARRYEGEMITVRIEGLSDFTVTPNHPILTQRGWVAAGALKLSDQLFKSVNPSLSVAILNPNDNHMETSIKEIADSLLVSGGVSTRGMPISAVAFHGDARFNDKVDIVRAAGDLSQNSEVFDNVCNHGFISRRGLRFVLASYGLVAHLVERFASASHRIIRGCHAGLSLLRRLMDGRHEAGLAAVTERQSESGETLDDNQVRATIAAAKRESANPSKIFGVHARNLGIAEPTHQVPSGTVIADKKIGLFEVPLDDPEADLQSVGDALHRLAGLIRRVKIVDIVQHNFCGQVYNLQTDSGFYFADGIIAHNCRCYLLAVKIKGL